MADAAAQLVQALLALGFCVGLPVAFLVWKAAGSARRAVWGSPFGMVWAGVGRWLGDSVSKESSLDDENVAKIKAHWSAICQSSGWSQSERIPREVKEYSGSYWTHDRREKTRTVNEQVWYHPILVNACAGPIGPTLTVRPLPGQNLGTFLKGADAAALGLGASAVRVRLSKMPGHVEIEIVTRDGLANTTQPAPNSAEVPVRLAAPPDLPVGSTQQGTEWSFPTREMCLIGGVPGSGKSVTTNAIICQAAKYPAISLNMIDLKGGVEAALVEPRLSAVGASYEEADQLLTEGCRIMDQRLAEMRKRGVRDFRDIGFTPETPLIMIVVDEAAELFATISSSKEDRALSANIEKNASRLVRLSRAAGFCIVMATQKPTVDAIPSQIRDQLQNRIALRCVTGEQSRVILGAASEEEQAMVTGIQESQRGYAAIRTPDGPTLARARFLSDEDVRAQIAATAHLAKPLKSLN